MVYQVVSPVRTNIWKAGMEVINSAVVTKNQEIDSNVSVEEAWIRFCQLSNLVTQPFIPRTAQKKKDMVITGQTGIFDVY